MKSTVRTIALWLLLLATSWQGVASAAMLGGDAIAHPGSPMAACDHAVMHAVAPGSAHRHHHPVRPAAHSPCGNCAACCVGFALQPALPVPPAADAGSFGPIPFLLARRAAFVPETPQRPPQGFLA